MSDPWSEGMERGRRLQASEEARPRRGPLIVALGIALGLALVSRLAFGQALTSSEETISVSTTTVGVTADLCGTGNRGGAYLQVLTNGVYLALHSQTATADSGDFRLDATTSGPVLWVKPANKIRMIRQSADSNVKVQCTE